MSETAEKPVFCANCGHPNPRANKFCGSCGTELVLPPSPPPTASAPLTPPTPPTPVAPPTPPSAPAPPAPTIAVPADLLARERELERLLTRANVERARALIRDARKTLGDALVIAQHLKPNAAAPVYEQLGDLLVAEERWEQAREHFEKALELTEHKRPAVEKKLAEVMLRLSDEEALKRLGALGPSEDLIDVLREPNVGRRNAGAAMLFSVVPGLGQFYCGQYIKAAILMGVFVISSLVIVLSPDRADLMEQLSGIFTLKPVRAASPSPVTVVASLAAFLAWLWSVADAPFSAGKTEEKALPTLSAAPMGKRSDWEP